MIEKLFRIVPTKVKLSDEIALVLHIIMKDLRMFHVEQKIRYGIKR